MSSTTLARTVLISALIAHLPAQAREPAAQSSTRTPEQIAWLTEQALPFDTVEAGNGFDDLMPLKELIGDARIVALGEPTHGSREVFQMKHRLVEFLATEMGFTIFSIEANMPEAYRVNNYVARGAGDPAELIEGMYFWTWNTEEVLAMVEWMRRFNASGRGHIDFTGFDMQTSGVAMQIVRHVIGEVDPSYLEVVTDAYAKAEKVPRATGSTAGMAVAAFPVEAAAGKTVTFRGSIKTEDVTDGWGALSWRVGGPDGELVADDMEGRGPSGTADWAEYELTIEVPEEAASIQFGVLMPGRGKAWFDDLSIEIDGVAYEDTETFDFDFEADEIRGFTPRRGNYRVSLDNSTAASGTQSLRIESIAVGRPQGISAEEAVALCRQVLDRMTAARGVYLRRAPADRVDWAIQNARVVLQGMRQRTGDFAARDRAMADNVAWILQQNPDDKIILWAHNGHVAKREGRQGHYLDQRYGDEQVVFGFATSEGQYHAVNQGGGGRGNHDLQTPPPGSIEAALESTGLPRLILDLRAARPGTAASGWLAEPVLIRSIGAMEMDQQFYPRPLTQDFDALIYIERTTPAIQIGSR